ncbi:hypothetical protein ABK040_006765 [Willaertia magna]
MPERKQSLSEDVTMDEEDNVFATPSSIRSGRTSISSAFTTPNQTPNTTPNRTTPKERRSNNRRKSTLFSPGIKTFDEEEENDDDREKSIAQKKRREKKRKSVGLGFLTSTATSSRRTSSQRSSTGRVSNATRTLTASELEDLFHNCIKLSTENKINAKNTWQLNLIDYIGEVIETTLGENNFQVASCTLDASVKIYSTRVDSVHTETYKVLTSFSRADSSKKPGDSVDEELNKDKDGGDEEKKKKQRVRHGVNTLETNISNLNVKKLDLTYTIEPLYHSSIGSSNSFDVGSAHSLLLNNLGIGDGCEVIIDAKKWDYSLKKIPEINKQQEEQAKELICETDLRMAETIAFDKTDFSMLLDENEKKPEQNTEIDSKEENIDVAIQQHDQIMAIDEIGGIGGIDTMEVGPIIEVPTRLSLQGEAANALLNAATTEVGGLAPDHFANNTGDDDDDDDGLGLYDTDFATVPVAPEIGEDEIVQIEETKQTQSDKTNGTGSIADIIQSNLDTLDLDNEYSYFDPGKLKHWAGVDHWKLQPKSKSNTTNTKTRKKRTTKEQFEIDFYNAMKDINIKTDFVVSKPSANQISDKTIKTANKKSNLLPDDYHYELSILLKPFNLPKFATAIINKSINLPTTTITEVGKERLGEEETIVPPPITATQMDDSDDDIMGGVSVPTFGGDEIGGLGSDNFVPETVPQDQPLPLESEVTNATDQSILDENIEVKQEEFASQAVESVGGTQLIEAPKLVERLNIKYATRAKQVDVRALKDHLWKDIKSNEEEKVDFKDLVSNLNTSKPKEDERKPDFSEVSVPFCFICMLHICNEQGLELEGSSDLSSFTIVKSKQ